MNSDQLKRIQEKFPGFVVIPDSADPLSMIQTRYLYGDYILTKFVMYGISVKIRGELFPDFYSDISQALKDCDIHKAKNVNT